jgi:hypothetical protein
VASDDKSDGKKDTNPRRTLPTSVQLELNVAKAELLLQVLRRFQLGGTHEQLRTVLPIYEELASDVARAVLFLKQGIVIQETPNAEGLDSKRENPGEDQPSESRAEERTAIS